MSDGYDEFALERMAGERCKQRYDLVSRVLFFLFGLEIFDTPSASFIFYFPILFNLHLFVFAHHGHSAMRRNAMQHGIVRHDMASRV